MIADEQIAQNYRRFRRCKIFWLILGGLAGTAVAFGILMVLTYVLLFHVNRAGMFLNSDSWREMSVVFALYLALVSLISLAYERRDPAALGEGNQGVSVIEDFGSFALQILASSQSAFYRGVMLLLSGKTREETAVVIFLCHRDFRVDITVLEQKTGIARGRFLRNMRRLRLLAPLSDPRAMVLAGDIKKQLLKNNKFIS